MKSPSRKSEQALKPPPRSARCGGKSHATRRGRSPATAPAIAMCSMAYIVALSYLMPGKLCARVDLPSG